MKHVFFLSCAILLLLTGHVSEATSTPVAQPNYAKPLTPEALKALKDKPVAKRVVTPAAKPSAHPFTGAKPLEEFTGTVTKNRDFMRDLKSYKGLTFRLTADLASGKKQGWVIKVTPKHSPGNDYAKIATKPFNGYNQRFISLSYGKPEAVVNENPRGFHFVTNEIGYKKAFDMVENLMWPSTRQDADHINMTEFPSGTFTILSSKVTEASIESITFKVQIFAPNIKR